MTIEPRKSNLQTKIVTSPERLSRERASVFLAGSIDMGAAEDWQSKVQKALSGHAVTIFNPRREDWDHSWKQDISDQNFREQVKWELDHLESANLILIYFAPQTKSPISLLELGLFATSQKCIVCCPPGFWRRGNIQILCQRYNIPCVDDFQTFIELAKSKLSVMI